MTRQSIEERFWAKVRKTDTCWEWIAHRSRKGYGRFGIGHGRAFESHRVAYELFIGPIPEGLFVLHTCDNPACVRPSHLYAGTSKDNVRDMWARGRAVPPPIRTRLDWGRVRDIRTLHAEGTLTYREIAKLYGVNESTISQAVRGRSWVADPAPAQRGGRR